MLMKMIADELLSDKTGDEIIDEINKAVDIPIISEKTEKQTNNISNIQLRPQLAQAQARSRRSRSMAAAWPERS